MKKLLTSCLFFAIINVQIVFCQLKIGEWRTHLPYYNIRNVVFAEDKVYAASDVGLFSYNLGDKSVETLSKINNFSDIGIQTMNYNQFNKVLVIAYENSNIDLVKNHKIINFPDLKNKIIQGGKKINDIMFYKEKAYLSTDFGILVFDTEREEFTDTYYIANEGAHIRVFNTVTDGNLIYASTAEGIYQAEINNTYLIDYHYWTKLDEMPQNLNKETTIGLLNNRLYVLGEANTSSSVIYVFDKQNGMSSFQTQGRVKKIFVENNKLIVIARYFIEIYNDKGEFEKRINKYNDIDANPEDLSFDAENRMWIADGFSGLFRETENESFEQIEINGPRFKNVVDIAISNNILWAVSGTRDLDKWHFYGAYAFAYNHWSSFNRLYYSILEDVANISTIAINPNSPYHVYAGSWGYGLVEFDNFKISKLYDHTNSVIEPISGASTSLKVRVGGMAFDAMGNLWFTTSQTKKSIYVKRNNGEIENVPIKNNIFSFNQKVFDIIVTQNNKKWLVVDKNGIFAFDDEGNEKLFSIRNENGKIISNQVSAIVEDLDGNIWLGTDKGIAVYYNPENVFDSYNFYAQQIVVDVDGIGGAALLKTEKITDIEVDGANRKWISTENSGVYLVSDDGEETIYHFTTENSPLLSDYVTCVAINEKTGEVFFGTSKGIISFQGKTTAGSDNFHNLYAYPNPVKQDYKGEIVINGVMKDTNVKITDIAGNLVYETTSLGGQALWNGKNLSGRRVNTGVYLVFCTNKDADDTKIIKILFIN